ncbi:hypothetical protein OG331_48200 [Streptomyces sp. NBC_01017]|uniref:hypothetical protein n=1 Tax=Streptomyces sp. NBC_01017 TaxID=2903721 RepID=UPI00386AA148|nr:hypothetical protein OG331_03780 [Streptomyces sp. NBC_01017]WSV34827.1 hypothetical protein OG331_48200 [Streptomyces sp. NBC_01017]
MENSEEEYVDMYGSSDNEDYNNENWYATPEAAPTQTIPSRYQRLGEANALLSQFTVSVLCLDNSGNNPQTFGPFTIEEFLAQFDIVGGQIRNRLAEGFAKCIESREWNFYLSETDKVVVTPDWAQKHMQIAINRGYTKDSTDEVTIALDVWTAMKLPPDPSDAGHPDLYGTGFHPEWPDGTESDTD